MGVRPADVVAVWHGATELRGS